MGKAHENTRLRGRAAALAGKPRSDCPYDRKGQVRNIPTGARGFANAWLDGYDKTKSEEAEARELARIRKSGNAACG